MASINEEDISKIYDNISFVRSNSKILLNYQKFLIKKDGNNEIKRKVESLIISGG